MPLGVEVGLGPSDTVLDGYPARPMENDTAAAHFLAYFALPSQQLLLIHTVNYRDYLL